jgi:hypothetical protein
MTTAVNNYDIAEIECGMRQMMRHRVVLPSSYYIIIVIPQGLPRVRRHPVTMAATMTRTIASIIEGRRRRWVVAIATPEVFVARPATVVASFSRTAGFKTGEGGGTHIQPPSRGRRTRRPPLDQALKLKGDTLSCGLYYDAIA